MPQMPNFTRQRLIKHRYPPSCMPDSSRDLKRLCVPMSWIDNTDTEVPENTSEQPEASDIDDLCDRFFRLRLSNKNVPWFRLPSELKTLILEYALADTKMRWIGWKRKEYRDYQEPNPLLLVSKDFITSSEVHRICLANCAHSLQQLPGYHRLRFRASNDDFDSEDFHLDVFPRINEKIMDRYKMVNGGWRHIVINAGEGMARDTNRPIWLYPPRLPFLTKWCRALRMVTLHITTQRSFVVRNSWDFPAIHHKAQESRLTGTGSWISSTAWQTVRCRRDRFPHYPYAQSSPGPTGTRIFTYNANWNGSDASDIVSAMMEHARGSQNWVFDSWVGQFMSRARAKGIELQVDLQFALTCHRGCCYALFSTKDWSRRQVSIHIGDHVYKIPQT